jgi:hypothetical protein
MSLDVRYVTDAAGERVAVILPIEEYEELLEDIHVIRVAYETRNEPRTPFAEVVAELRAEGKID